MDAATLQDHLAAVVEKLKEPLLPTHLVNWLLSVVLLGCVANSHADVNGERVCGFAKDEGVCSSTNGFAVAAFLTSTVFVALELRWERLANYHRNIYLGELIVAGVYVLVFFGFFVKLASAWTNTDDTIKGFVGHGNPGTAIAVTLLSMGSWGFLAWLSYKGYKEDDLGGIERLGAYGGVGSYVDPVTSAYHGGVGLGGGGTSGGGLGASEGAGLVSAAYDEAEPPVP